MADEEAVLKKKLEDTTNFEERREIRQQLRELRKKKLDALESDTTANERPRRRKRDEQSTVITETRTTKTKTTDVSDGDSSQPPSTQTKIEVNYSRTVITDEPSENGIENGHAESVEEETVSVEDEKPVEEQPVEIDIGTQFSLQINGEQSPQDSQEEQEESAPQIQISTETETVVESSETVADEEPQEKEEETEEVELTPEVVEKMEDVDQLERLLKEVPLNEYALRKAIRLQIRQLRVKKAMQKNVKAAPKFKLEAPAPKGMRNERFSIDIQDKNELQKLREGLLKEREQKDKDPSGGTSVTKTVEPEGDGTKEVTTMTEKSTEVDETDGGQAEITTEVKKTTEVHKAGGATMTVTRTSKTTEVRQTGGSKGASIDALFAQKKKEKMMAKKQQHADSKNQRMAFKQQLEASSPKVEGGARNFTSGNTAIGQLQEWCRRRTKYHEGVDIQNFTTSWANGLAMCALLNYYLPEKIPYDTLDAKDKRGNWALAFKVAGEEGIEPLLELEDVMAVDVPEPKSLITYVHFVYTHFSEKQQLQKKA